MRSAVLLLSLVPGCYASHGLEGMGPPVACDEAPPLCTTRESPCDALRLVDAACRGEVWSCPAGSTPYVAPWSGDRCLPLFADVPAPGGVNEAPVPMPVGDRCAWVYPSLADGISLEATFAASSCEALELPMPLETHGGEGYDAVMPQASFLDASGRPLLLMRGWRFEVAVPTPVGSSFGRLVGDTITISSTWAIDPMLGAAAVADGGFLYAYGCLDDPYCRGDDAVVARAPLARIDEPAAWSYFGAGGWGVGEPAPVFRMGPHRGAVVHDPRGGFLHVYVDGYGTSVEWTHAERPEGPWSTPRVLVACELPSDDPAAFCAAPVIHLELFDPTRPDELVIGYALTTSAPDGWTLRTSRRESYWPRIVRVRR